MTIGSRAWLRSTAPFCTSTTRSAVLGRFSSVVITFPLPMSSYERLSNDMPLDYSTTHARMPTYLGLLLSGR